MSEFNHKFDYELYLFELGNKRTWKQWAVYRLGYGLRDFYMWIGLQISLGFWLFMLIKLGWIKL